MRRFSSRPRVEWLLTLPSLLWLVFLFLLPTLLVMAIAFKPADNSGGIAPGWTLDTIKSLANPSYPVIVWRTLWLAAAETLICLLLALPVAYWLARIPEKKRKWALLLIILPFWTNFLIRIFAWKSLLHAEGWLKQALVFAGLVQPNDSLLFNVWAVLVVLVYTSLPFAILPLYAAAEKFDFGLLDAAMDLGASRFQAFLKVFLPGVRRGLITAMLVTMIPAIGSYAIPDIIGGVEAEMVGSKIAQRVFNDRNLPHASALASVMALAVLTPLLLSVLLGRGDSGRKGASP